MISRRAALMGLLALPLPPKAALAKATRISAEPWATKLVAAAKQQIGVTVSYDPAYRRLPFPGGAVPRQAGVCTDVIIRAYRDAMSIDLQERVNHDMKRAFDAYPKNWGLTRTDPNIDHRRVPNLKVFFIRSGAARTVTPNAADYLPGNMVAQMLPGNLPHIALVSDELNADESRPIVIHNIGRGAQMEDTLFAFDITGHCRLQMVSYCDSDLNCKF